MKYEVKFTGQFKKDLKLAKRQGKDLDELFAVVDKLANGEKRAFFLNIEQTTGGFHDLLLLIRIPGKVRIHEIFDKG